MTEETKQEIGWAIVELMGHVCVAGRVTEEERFGTKLGRVDVPKLEKCSCPDGQTWSGNEPSGVCPDCNGTGQVEVYVSQYFGGSSVYRLTPCTEEVARRRAGAIRPEPLSRLELPKPVSVSSDPATDDNDEDDYEDRNDYYDDQE